MALARKDKENSLDNTAMVDKKVFLAWLSRNDEERQR
jgi:hypothetical protein